MREKNNEEMLQMIFPRLSFDSMTFRFVSGYKFLPVSSKIIFYEYHWGGKYKMSNEKYESISYLFDD